MRDRRAFLQSLGRLACSSAAIGAGIGLYGRHVAGRSARRPTDGEPPVLRPPGALPETAFLGACIRCQTCRDTCPALAIQLAGPGDSVRPDTPFIRPEAHACTLCLQCTVVCPTGALRPVMAKEDVRMGVAVVDERSCVSHNGSGVCGACHTACPLRNRAITQGLRNRPLVHAEHCVGCGLCEEACILDGTKAIRVFSERAAA